MVCQTLPEKKIPEKYSRTKPHYLYLYQLDHLNTIPESHQQAFTNCVHGYDRARKRRYAYTKTVPLDGTHLVAVGRGGLITKRCPPKYVNGKSSSERRYFVR